MKNNYWLIFSMMLSTTLLAQPATNAPSPAAPAAPASAPAALEQTNAPLTKPEKKKAAKKTAAKKNAAAKKEMGAELKTVPLVAGQAMVVASNVNVRGQAKLNSEVVTRLTKGDVVSVLEE